MPIPSVQSIISTTYSPISGADYLTIACFYAKAYGTLGLSGIYLQASADYIADMNSDQTQPQIDLLSIFHSAYTSTSTAGSVPVPTSWNAAITALNLHVLRNYTQYTTIGAFITAQVPGALVPNSWITMCGQTGTVISSTLGADDTTVCGS